MVDVRRVKLPGVGVLHTFVTDDVTLLIDGSAGKGGEIHGLLLLRDFLFRLLVAFGMADD